MSEKTKVAVIGSGNIGTDLMMKIVRSQHLEMAALVGIDPASEGLARARQLGVTATHEGVEGLIGLPSFADVRIVFDATSASAHIDNEARLRRVRPDVRLVDLTPAAVGPYCVPVVNLDAHRLAPNVNMVTCGGQATIPIVAAVSRIAKVHYAEIVAAISSRSAGPGTRANIDEFVETTAKAIEVVGGSRRGRAILILNPAEPPQWMRDTVFVFSEDADERRLAASIEAMVGEVQTYVPDYRLKQEVQFERMRVNVPQLGELDGLRTSVFIEVAGAADYLPAFAGNLDIMTAAARATGERIAHFLRS